MKKTMLDFLDEVSIEHGYRGWYDVYIAQEYIDCNMIPQQAGVRYGVQCVEEALTKGKHTSTIIRHS